MRTFGLLCFGLLVWGRGVSCKISGEGYQGVLPSCEKVWVGIRFVYVLGVICFCNEMLHRYLPYFAVVRGFFSGVWFNSFPCGKTRVVSLLVGGIIRVKGMESS